MLSDQRDFARLRQLEAEVSRLRIVNKRLNEALDRAEALLSQYRNNTKGSREDAAVLNQSTKERADVSIPNKSR